MAYTPQPPCNLPPIPTGYDPQKNACGVCNTCKGTVRVLLSPTHFQWMFRNSTGWPCEVCRAGAEPTVLPTLLYAVESGYIQYSTTEFYGMPPMIRSVLMDAQRYWKSGLGRYKAFRDEASPVVEPATLNDAEGVAGVNRRRDDIFRSMMR